MFTYKKVTHYVNVAMLVLVGLSYLLILILGMSSASESDFWGKLFAFILYLVATGLFGGFLAFYCVKSISDADWEMASTASTVVASVGQIFAVVAIVWSNVSAASHVNVWQNLVDGWLIMSAGFALFAFCNRWFWGDSFSYSTSELHSSTGYSSGSNSYSSGSSNSESDEEKERRRKREEADRASEEARQEERRREEESREYYKHYYHTETEVEVRQISAVYSSPVMGAPVCDYEVNITFTFKTASGSTQTKKTSFKADCQSATMYHYSASDAEYSYGYMLDDYYY